MSHLQEFPFIQGLATREQSSENVCPIACIYIVLVAALHGHCNCYVGSIVISVP